MSFSEDRSKIIELAPMELMEFAENEGYKVSIPSYAPRNSEYKFDVEENLVFPNGFEVHLHSDRKDEMPTWKFVAHTEEEHRYLKLFAKMFYDNVPGMVRSMGIDVSLGPLEPQDWMYRSFNRVMNN